MNPQTGFCFQGGWSLVHGAQSGEGEDPGAYLQTLGHVHQAGQTCHTWSVGGSYIHSGPLGQGTGASHHCPPRPEHLRAAGVSPFWAGLGASSSVVELRFRCRRRRSRSCSSSSSRVHCLARLRGREWGTISAAQARPLDPWTHRSPVPSQTPAALGQDRKHPLGLGCVWGLWDTGTGTCYKRHEHPQDLIQRTDSKISRL